VLLVAEVLGHLRLQSTLDETGGQLLEDAGLAGQVLGFLVADEELVDQLVGDPAWVGLLGHGGPP
jgi:hypothetical protein